MTTTTDFVVAGGGHNSLITAAYLARAGYEVVVLDWFLIVTLSLDPIVRITSLPTLLIATSLVVIPAPK